jgi:Zn-dependent protease
MNHILFSIIAILAMLISLSTHEFSHALMGFVLGDQTAKRMGRLTLNPLAHIDPIGTVLVPILGAISGFPLIGWAKPVPFNPHNLKYPKWGPTFVALAGPLSNFLLAFVYLFLLRFVLTVLHMELTNLLVMFLLVLAIINTVLGIFNFIPVPPLDGSKLLHSLLDHPKYAHALALLESRGPLILMGIIFLDYASPTPLLGTLFNAVLGFVFRLAGMEGLLGLIG